ncbi:FAD binding domain-containing protein [Sphingomonas pituitosa]|uniref:FAD binding domain-containing protein n=1 Tax=Sphingomonas pituitosa TaxID=99597 RepID=UPI0008375222|nr:hypothetical protein [Sphingomonas pituitosa]
MSPGQGRRPRVVVAGGSIAGLGAGVALHRAGIDVDLFERDPSTLRSTGAGLVIQPELTALVQVPGGPGLPITRCVGRRTLEPDGSASPLQAMPQTFTSWQAVHSVLLRQFPAERYHAGAVVGEAAPHGDGLTIPIAGFGTVEADVLIAGDGGRSAIRRRMLPELEAGYAGYVAWRGTIREADMPRDLVAVFDDVFTFADARSGGHALAYFIPGDDLGTGPGERRMNWVWYVGASPRERDALLVDRDGQQREASLQRGMAREDVVAAFPAFAAAELHPAFAQLVAATPDPFLQTIVDLGVPQSVFGRTALIGDAAFIVRPHTAGGAAKAARDALAIADQLRRTDIGIDAALAAFQRDQLAYGRDLLAYGIALGRRWARL